MGGQILGAVARSQVSQVGDGGQLDATGTALGVEGAIHQQILDHADLPESRRGQGESDGAAALDNVGLADHALGGGIGEVVDGGETGPGVDAGLVRSVGLRAPVPVEVVRGQVEARRGQGREGPGGVQLETGQLHGQGVCAAGQHRLDGGRSDIADGWGGESLGLEDGREHTDRSGLAVRAGERQPGDIRSGGVLLEPPGQLDLAPSLDADRLGGAQDRTRGRNAG